MEDYQVDMHIHTTASDGTWTIEELLDRIIKNNIKLFSITDHDTIENSIRMLEIIPNNIRYIIGVEISATYNNVEYHITAYDFDYKNTKLNDLLEFNRIQREDFNTKIIQYVKESERIKDIKDYYSYKYNRCRGGWESLNYLLDKNVIKSLNEYFEIIKLSNEKLCFKNPKEIIEIVKDAGGYSFLAHPSAYEKGEKLPLEVLNEWRDYGISGIECFSPYLKGIEDSSYYLRFCEENNLMISAGSDCHGEFNNRTLGIPKVNIDEIKMDFIRTHNLQKTLVIGIDGLGGTGKTTIANSLKLELSNKNYNSIILHIDDFIHPRNIRYNEAKEEWYCYYNIQWRYDYLIKEILMPIKEGIELDKQIEIYDKDNDIYILEQIKIPQGSILLLEGIFLQRKEIRGYFDYIIYLDTPKEVRLNRVINRDKYIGNWEDIKLKYERRYFPAENKYIEEYCPMKNADLVLNYVRNREDNKMIIREATLSDACGIAKVHVDTWRTTYKGIVNDEFLNELSYDKREKMWIIFINNSIINNKHIFVVEDEENGIIGFDSYGMERENDNLSHGELYAIYILEKYQNKGIGRLLFNCVIKRLDELKFKSLLIWALEDNYQACKFYELLGGKKVKEKYIEIGKDRFKEIAYSWLI